MLCMLNAKIKDVILVGLKSETNRIWSEQELNEKSAWAFQHPHNEKERRKIRIDIADEIEEILANEGFVRCRTTFFRANGDNLLQYISVRCYGMYGQPEIDVELEPLYNVFDFVRRTMNEMVTDEGIEGESIETLQNIHIHPVYNSYLAHKDDYMSEMKKEKEILSKVIRNLNEIDNLKKYDNIHINSTENSIPYIINFSVIGVKPETFIHTMEEEDIYLSTKSACSTSDVSLSVDSIYHNREISMSSIRISLSYKNTEEEIDKFIKAFDKIYNKLVFKK